MWGEVWVVTFVYAYIHRCDTHVVVVPFTQGNIKINNEGFEYCLVGGRYMVEQACGNLDGSYFREHQT